MKTSQAGIDLIKSFESLKLEAYPDPAEGWNLPTIGYGHTKNVKKGDRLKDASEADSLLAADLEEFEALVNSHFAMPLSQHQFDACVSIVFNVGPGNPTRDGIIRLRNGQPSTLLRKINAGDHTAAAEFPKWCHEGATVSVGLLRRRNAERDLFLTADLPTAA